MKKFKEFLAFVAKQRAEESAEEKSDFRGGLTTSDNKKVDEHLFNSVKMVLAGCSLPRIKELGKDEIFDRLAENFIKANTEKDIDQIVIHHLVLKMIDILAR